MRQWMAGVMMALMLHTAHAAAPDISLPDLQGRTHHLNEYIGHGKWW